MQIKQFVLFLIIFFLMSSFLSAQIMDSLTTAALDSCLTLLHLEKEELGFEKAWAKDDTFKLSIIDDLLDDPLFLPEYTQQTANSVENNQINELYTYIIKQLDGDLKNEQIIKNNKSEEIEEKIEQTLDKAEQYRRSFYADLSSQEIHDLILVAPGLWCESEEDSLKGSWQKEFNVAVDTSRVVDKDDLLNIFKKLDKDQLYTSGYIFMQLVNDLITMDFPDDIRFKIDGVTGEVLYYQQTKYGDLVIGSKDDNIYTKDFAFIIDIGGNDTYRCRAASALGELSSPFSFVIDQSGDDIYFNEKSSVNFGSGFLGVGILYDLNGNDVYRGGNYSLGSALCGIGLIIDDAGIDDYRGGCFTQGAGHYGIGILKDLGDGDDRYMAKLWAQGFGSTFGYGILHDEKGDETYRTGGEFLHAPLLPNDYQSFSHGFGMGWRPRAGGGIGVLLDGDGNDFYDGEVFCEGSAYWYSLGILIDGGGNDSYNAAQYAQGAGIHLALGSLWDRGGDDQYHSRNGVVGGTAHDLSVGMLFEEEGNDNYIVSGGYGVSLTNSVALFVDKQGNDMYSTWEDNSFGSVRWARGFSGCGIFMDLEGKDVYSRNTAAEDGKLWLKNGWGIGIDLDNQIIEESKKEKEQVIVLTAEDSLKKISQLYEEASLWEVGSNKEKVARAKKAFLARGMEGVKYICENRLGTTSSLELRLIETVTKEFPDSIAPLLIPKIKDDDEQVQKNAIRLIGTAKYADAYDNLIEMLQDPENNNIKRNLIGALGNIGNKDAADIIIRYLTDEDELCRLSAINALKKLKNNSADTALINALDDSIFTVRSAAYSAVIELADFNTSKMIYDKIKLANSKYPELLVRTLSNIEYNFADSTKTEYKKQRRNSQKLFIKLVSHHNPLIRAEAVKAVYLNLGVKKKRWLTEIMEDEKNKFVQAAYEEIKK